MKTVTKMANAKSLVVFKEADPRGRQCLVLRTVQGDRLFETRRVKSLANFIKSKYPGRPIKVFDELPASAQADIRHNMEVGVSVNRLGESYRPTLGDIMIGQLMGA